MLFMLKPFRSESKLLIVCFHIVTKQYSLVNGKVSYSSIENATTLYKHHLNTSKFIIMFLFYRTQCPF